MRLNKKAKELLEEDISLDKFFDAVMTLKNGKVPGLDGLTVEFY